MDQAEPGKAPGLALFIPLEGVEEGGMGRRSLAPSPRVLLLFYFSFQTLRLSSIFFRTRAQVGRVRKESR